MITIPTKSANYDPENIKFFHNLYIFALEINYFFQFCYLFVRRLARSPKRNKRKVVSGSKVTLPQTFAYKPGLSFSPLARVTLAVGLPYLLVNRALLTSFSPAVRTISYVSSFSPSIYLLRALEP